MPYAPGVQPRAGEIFAASQFGSRISENVQNWMKNREEREQTTATAEMLGRYLKDDPHAMEMFGPKFADIPKGSAAQAKATIGAATMYLAQKQAKVQQDQQQQQLDLAKDQYKLLAQRNQREVDRSAKFQKLNQEMALESNLPLMFKDAAGPRQSGLTPEAFQKAAIRAGVWGEPEATQAYTALSAASTRMNGLPLGETLTTKGGDRLIGRGWGQPPDVVPAKVPKGLDFGATKETPEGTIVGMGVDNEVKFVPSADKSKPSPLDQGFVYFSPVYGHQLDSAEAAIDKYGKTGALWGEGYASLKQLPAMLAASYAKVTDPTGVVRESDIDIFTSRLFPQGPATKVSTTKEALANLRKDLILRVQTWGANTREKTKIPEGMPEWVIKGVKEPIGVAGAGGGSPASPPTQVPRRAIRTPEGKLMEIRADQYEEALKAGYKAP